LKPGNKWHLKEVFVRVWLKIDHLWGAVDQKYPPGDDRVVGAEDAAPRRGDWARKEIDPGDRQRFAEIVEAELTSLHESNFARYRIRPSEFGAWRQVWNAR
jgi:hypothetical protein